jgi:hypothetical protein
MAVILIAQGGIIPWYSDSFIYSGANTKPDVAHGVTAPLNDHGTTIYVKPWQSFLLYEGMAAMVVGFGLLGIQWLIRERDES